MNLGFILIFVSLLLFQIFTSLFAPDLAVWEHSAPLAKVLVQVIGIDLIQHPLFNFFSASLLILFQLILVYNLINKIKNLEKYSVLVTWLYCCLLHLFPAWSKLSPPLIALTILLFILYRIYGAIEDKPNHFVFVVSTLIGISFLIWYPSILLLAYLLIVLFQHNVLSLKRIIIINLSFAVPVIWYLSYFILSNQELELFYQFSNFHITKISFHYYTWYQYASMLLLLVFSVFGLFQAINLSNKTAKMSRLFLKSLFTLCIVLLFSLMLSTNDFSYSLPFLLFPIALFLALFINIFKRPLLAELIHFTILLSILINFVSLYSA